jgi:uracil phosphoribosyltransferase
MRVHVADHQLISHKLTYLRDKRTDSPTFRRLVDELVTLLAYEATRDVRVEPFEIETPVAPTTGIKLANPKPLVVPILRAGLGMLDGMVRILPTAEVGFLGMMRNEETLEATTYANRLPENLHGRQCYVLDPMLATAAPSPWRSGIWSTAARTTSPRSRSWPRPRASPTSNSRSRG